MFPHKVSKFLEHHKPKNQPPNHAIKGDWKSHNPSERSVNPQTHQIWRTFTQQSQIFILFLAIKCLSLSSYLLEAVVQITLAFYRRRTS